MFDRIDDIIKRFVAVFLFPLINLLVIIGIAYLVTVPNTHALEGFGSFWTTILDRSSQFIAANLAAITATLKEQQSVVQAVGSALAVSLFFVVVLSIYLIDRAAYFFGSFCPPNFQFDLESYETKAGDYRGAAVKHIFGGDCTIANCYGAVRAYLGDQNKDQYRISHRDKIVGGIERAKTVFAYTKAYILCWAAILATSSIDCRWATATLFSLLLVLITCIWYISFAYRTLLEYDLDSFIWARSYETAQAFDVNAIAKLGSRPPRGCALRNMGLLRFNDWLNLRVVLFDTES